ncbi:MAG: hypothetical protein ACJ8AW_10245 [Rhodopila sp.]
MLFEAVNRNRLDNFFRLRLAQILDDKPPLPSLSVVVLAPDTDSDALPGGFAYRFRSAWPFARCAFVTVDADPSAAQATIGLPVTRLEPSAPVVLHTDATAGQPVALQIQPLLGRCGSTTAFQNQVEDLARAGFFTVRVLADSGRRRGPTLAAAVQRYLPENNRDAAAHVEVVAAPRTPSPRKSRAASARPGQPRWLATLRAKSTILPCVRQRGRRQSPSPTIFTASGSRCDLRHRRNFCWTCMTTWKPLIAN